MNETHSDLRTFTRQARLRGVLTAHTALRVGAGRAYDVLSDDLLVVKDTLKRPVIPGSSLKGALRAYAEQVLRTLEQLTQRAGGDPPLSCDPLSAPCLSNAQVEELKRRRDADQQLRERSCWACRVFGAPWMASRVLVKDLAVPEEAWFDLFGHRDGVSINRDKGTAQEKRRYTFEVVPKNTPFTFEVVVDDANDAELGLLLLALEGLNNGLILLGGARSRGLASVTLEVDWARVEEVVPANALVALGARALGEEVPTTRWIQSQRYGWIEAFFQAIGLPDADLARWRAARNSEVGNGK